MRRSLGVSSIYLFIYRAVCLSVYLSISLSIPLSLQRALILRPDGHHYLLQPVPEKHARHIRSTAVDAQNTHPHIIFKRSAFSIMGETAESPMTKSCLLSAKDDPLPLDEDQILLDDQRHQRLAVMKVRTRGFYQLSYLLLGIELAES